ncbi:MAG TPA: DHA2 family efflux MFS transporter permease subunit [Nevskia sp.]|nr:DHA2 family efflux MFS transporter permease subunit [Nevskia sp.]
MAQGASAMHTGDQAARARQLRDWTAFLAITIGSFIAILDIQIVASSLNEIRAGLSASVDEIQWVQTSYLIAEIIAIPLSGYLAPMLSTRVFYTIAAIGFTLSSLACGFAWSLGSMVVFRVLQGFLGGGLIPASFATMFLLFPREKDRELPQLLGGMATMLAPAIGPTFGGWITESLSWRWLFLINFVPGLACAFIVWSTLDVDRPKRHLLKNLDLVGVLFMALFLGALEYTLDDGPRHDWFDDDAVAVCAVLAAIGGGVFLWRGLRSEHPIVDLRAFRNRNFAVTCLVSAVLGMSIFTLIYLTPLFLGQVSGYNPQQIGAVMMVQGLAMIVAAPFVMRVANALDPRVTIAIGLVLVAAGSWANAQMTADWGYAQFVLPQALRGAGLIFSFVPMTNLALGTMERHELNNASALYTVTRNLGGAFGLAVVATLINRRTWTHWQALAESTRLSRPAVREALDGMSAALRPALGGDSAAGAVGMLAQQAARQAATMTYSDMYLLLSISTLLSVCLVPLIRKPAQQVGGIGH